MARDFKDYKWAYRYCTSSYKKDEKPTDILHEFYLPALNRATQYDRVAGYFRSTSLAAASQGYTAFLNHGGHMRLIVGADLQIQDVAAILAGNQARLSDNLMAELDDAESWPDDVQNGVALLAEMVASGQLEVKVAFRVNAITHQPLNVDSTEDGYVHEKWFLMTDAEGNRLYGSGSLNESRTALVKNAENIDIHCDWKGEDNLERVEGASRDFEFLWSNKNPHMVVLPIPTAVKERLIHLKTIKDAPTEIDGTVIQTEVKPSIEEILKFLVLRDAPKMPGGIYLGMYTAPVEPWPHQEIVSRKLVESWPYSYMMCDEVGLGKTIEAALAIRSLVLSGRAKRVLIVAPASLTEQWHRELAQKACLPFYLSRVKPGYSGKIQHNIIYPFKDEELDANLFSPDLNIVSSGLVSRKDRLRQFESVDGCDIILVDEAHYARRQNPRDGSEGLPKYGNLYKSMQSTIRSKAESLWMATATPMQIDAVEVYDLFKLTNRVGAYQADPTLSMAYFQLLGKILNDRELTSQQWSMLGQSFAQLPSLDPYLWHILQETVVSSKNRKVLDQLPVRTPKHADIKYLIQPLFSASPLSRVMMRHTRQLLELYKQNGELTSNLAKRHVLPVCTVKFTSNEAIIYNLLEEYCNELSRQIKKNNTQSKQVMIFLLNFLQLRFASSIYAIKMTLARRLKRVEYTLLMGAKAYDNQEELDEAISKIYDSDDDYAEGDLDDITLDTILKDRSKKDLEWEKKKLGELIKKLDSMSETPSKIQRLLEILDSRMHGGRLEQTVLFTRFYDSLSSIRDYLLTRDPTMRVGIYAGGRAIRYDPTVGKDVNTTHEEIKRLFLSGEIDLLLCTDAAAEGLNLQTANLLINFDLGWNPMKIEQRIGRIDRIGQKYSDIAVINMCYLGSTEEIVYGRLFERLKEANLVVGTQQISMLPVEPKEFADIQSGKLTADELEKISIDRLKQQRQNTARMEMSAEDQYEIYKKQSAQMQQRHYPASLEDLWTTITQSKYLQSKGAHLDGHKWILPPSETFYGVTGSIDRSIDEDGCEFLTWGNARIDNVLNVMCEMLPEETDCIKRISVKEDHCEFIGYAVGTTTGIQLITSVDQLSNISVDVHTHISEADIARCSSLLLALVHAELITQQSLRKSENRNKAIADLHTQLIKYVAMELLDVERIQGNERFVDAIKNIEQSKKQNRIIKLPADVFGGRANMLLFPVSEHSGEAYINGTGILIECAVELTKRIAATTKQKKSDIKTIDIIHRLSRK